MSERQTDSGIFRALDRPELKDLRDVGRKMLLSRDPAEIARLLSDALRRVTKAPRVAVFLTDQPPFDPTDSVLLPEKEMIEYAFQSERPPVLPAAGGLLIAVLPLRVGEQQVGVVSVDLTGIGEDFVKINLDPVVALTDPGAVALLNAQVVGRTQGESTLLLNILDSITNGIITVDNEKRITRLNRNAMAMLELGHECIGRAYQEVLTPQVCDALDELIRETTEMGFAMEKVVQQKLSQGPELHLAISTSVLRGEEFQPLGMILIFRDMTASRELDRLRKLDTMKSEFVANVSHELKTPLTSIKAYTEALLDMTEDDQMKQFLKVIDEESDRLLFLINDLLNVSRIQSGKMKMNFALTEPKSIVHEVLSISKVQSTKHKIVLEIADGLPEMMLDKEKLKEVMINLMSNAIKYSPDGGNVWVRMRQEESNLRIEIQDQGMGISKENLPKLFNAFYRVDSSITAEIPGTGLGLVIVKAIVEHHGGKIWLDSDLGKGTTFFILIPIKREIKQAVTGFAE